MKNARFQKAACLAAVSRCSIEATKASRPISFGPAQRPLIRCGIISAAISRSAPGFICLTTHRLSRLSFWLVMLWISP
jgi:hypothetical protein